MAKIVPSYTGTLRSHSLMLPACISECSGIRIFGGGSSPWPFPQTWPSSKTSTPTPTCHRRPYRGEHPAHHPGRGQCRCLHAPVTGALFSQIMNRYRESGQESENLDGETV